MDIEHLADASGGLAWISGRLFEIQGRLAVQPAEGSELGAGIRILLARSSRRHGQHCQWWRDLLPDSPALNAAGRVRPPSSAWANALDCIEAAPQADAVAVLHEVAVPELAFVLSRLRQAPSPVSDGAFMRTARMVAADLAEEQRDAKGCRPIPGVSSKAEIAELSMSFAGDRREKKMASAGDASAKERVSLVNSFVCVSGPVSVDRTAAAVGIHVSSGVSDCAERTC